MHLLPYNASLSSLVGSLIFSAGSKSLWKSTWALLSSIGSENSWGDGRPTIFCCPV